MKVKNTYTVCNKGPHSISKFIIKTKKKKFLQNFTSDFSSSHLKISPKCKLKF